MAQCPRKRGKGATVWVGLGLLDHAPELIGSIFFFSDDKRVQSVDWTRFQALMEDNAFEEILVYTAELYQC